MCIRDRYFSSTLGYFQDLLSDKRLSFENNSLILNLADLERQWQNYYTRCLTIISGNDHALVKKIIQNGYNLLTLQKKLFISCLLYTSVSTTNTRRRLIAKSICLIPRLPALYILYSRGCQNFKFQEQQA